MTLLPTSVMKITFYEHEKRSGNMSAIQLHVREVRQTLSVVDLKFSKNEKSCAF